MQQGINSLVLKLVAITAIASSFLIMFNVWVLPIIYSGERKGYVVFPVLLFTLVIVSWLVFAWLPIESVWKKLLVSIAYGIAVSFVVLCIALLVILNTLGA